MRNATDWAVRMIKAAAALMCLLLVPCAAARGQTFCYTEENSAYLKATGLGYYSLKVGRNEAQQRLMAERAAKVDAYRKIARSYGVVQRRVYGAGNEDIRVSGFIGGVEVVETRYYSNGRVEVDAVLPLDRCEPAHSQKLNKDGIAACQVVAAPKTISKEEYEELFR